MKVAVPTRAAAKDHQRTTPPRHSPAAATGRQSSRPMMPGRGEERQRPQGLVDVLVQRV